MWLKGDRRGPVGSGSGWFPGGHWWLVAETSCHGAGEGSCAQQGEVVGVGTHLRRSRMGHVCAIALRVCGDGKRLKDSVYLLVRK